MPSPSSIRSSEACKEGDGQTTAPLEQRNHSFSIVPRAYLLHRLAAQDAELAYDFGCCRVQSYAPPSSGFFIGDSLALQIAPDPSREEQSPPALRISRPNSMAVSSHSWATT